MSFLTVGNTFIKYTIIVPYDRIPECPPPASRVHPRPTLTAPCVPERTVAMKITPKRQATSGGTETTVTLQDVIHAIEGLETLAVTRRRDLRSAVKRVATLLADD